MYILVASGADVELSLKMELCGPGQVFYFQEGEYRSPCIFFLRECPHVLSQMVRACSLVADELYVRPMARAVSFPVTSKYLRFPNSVEHRLTVSPSNPCAGQHGP